MLSNRWQGQLTTKAQHFSEVTILCKEVLRNILSDHILTDINMHGVALTGMKTTEPLKENTQPERAQFQKQKELYCYQSHALWFCSCNVLLNSNEYFSPEPKV